MSNEETLAEGVTLRSLSSKVRYRFRGGVSSKNDEETEYKDNESLGHISGHPHTLGYNPDISEADNINFEYASLLDDSPYPEVRAAVPNIDDTSLPIGTLRMWILGILVTTMFSGLNLFFSLRTPPFSISAFVGSLVVWPLGMLWAKYVPNYKIFGMDLNPGPFNIKEHTVITIMGNMSYGEGPSYSAQIVLSLKKFYNINYGWWFEMCTAVSIQAVGYSMAGIMRPILVYPASMIWPSNLVASTFLTNIHMNINHVANGWNVSRLRFFVVVCIGSFIWYWIPGYLASFLSYFAFPTWFAPKNVIINQLFGVQTGLGLIPLTFDWNQISSYIGSPLIPPSFVIGNIFVSIVIIYWLITPILYYSNWSSSLYMPISDSNTYDRYQNKYTPNKIMTDNKFDEEKYKNYSPIFMSATFIVSYGMSFAGITSTLVHTILYHGKDIIFYFRHSRKEPDDIHMKLMRNYKECPQWWFISLLVLLFGLCIINITVWNSELPIWALILALFIAFIFLIPVGLIYAVTNIPIGLNVITEFIVGYILPGKPLAMMFFKSYGYITNAYAITFLQDMKLGHYMKIPPRTLFFAQLISSIWGGVVQILVLHLSDKYIKNLCSPHQTAHFTCNYSKVFFNASILWGVIGPKIIFTNGMYNSLLWWFLLGAILPIINFLISKKYPNSFIKYIHWPVFFNATGMIPPATAFNYGTYCIVGYIFGYVIKKKYFSWWAKYNYTLSAGLDIGLVLSALLIFFTITLSDGPNWWGNNVVNNTLDTQNKAIQIILKEGESFGPSTW